VGKGVERGKGRGKLGEVSEIGDKGEERGDTRVE
jgi:hypothetical protein